MSNARQNTHLPGLLQRIRFHRRWTGIL